MTLNIAELKSKGGVGYTRSTVDAPVQLNPLPQTHEGSFKYPRAVGLAGIVLTLVACQATALATPTESPQGGNPTLIAPLPTETVQNPAQIEATATPKIEISMPAPIDGLYYGSYGVDSDNQQVVTGAIDPADFDNNNPNSPYKVPSYGNGEVQANTLYSETNSQEAAATMLDQKWLDGYFQAQTDKTGVTTGVLPDGSTVTKQGLFWVDEKGYILNPIVRNIAGDDSKFGWPMLTVKDNQLFMAVVDGDGALVAGEQFHPAFQSPSAIAESVGFDNPKDVARVALSQTGILQMFDNKANLIGEVVYVGNAEIGPLIEVDGVVIKDPVVSNPELFDVKKHESPIPHFIESMKLAGINLEAQNVLGNLAYEQRTSIYGQPIILGYYNLDPKPNTNGEPLEGKVPFFIALQNESGEWVWQQAGSGDLARLTGRTVGTPVEPSNLNEPAYRDLVLNFSNIIENNYNLTTCLKPGQSIENIIDEIKLAQNNSSNELDPSEFFDFSGYDSRIRFGNENNMEVESLALFASWLFPDQIKQDLASGKLAMADFEMFLQFYTKAFVGRYDGQTDPMLKVNSWVVGNEVTTSLMWADDDTKKVMQKVINEGVIARMFITANEANPDAKLLFSDDHLLESQETDLRPKFLQVVDTLQSQGAPIDGIAIQNHLWLGRPLLSVQQIEGFFQELERRHLEISYNEITISVSQTNQYTGESVAAPFVDPYLKQAEFLQTLLTPMRSRDGSSIIFYTISDTPGPFDEYNLNDPTADAVMYTSYKNPEPRPMYYVLLQELARGLK